MMEGANIKLSGTVSDINGKSARSILEYLLTGESIDSEKYKDQCPPRKETHICNGYSFVKVKGHFSPDRGFCSFLWYEESG